MFEFDSTGDYMSGNGSGLAGAAVIFLVVGASLGFVGARFVGSDPEAKSSAVEEAQIDTLERQLHAVKFRNASLTDANAGLLAKNEELTRQIDALRASRPERPPAVSGIPEVVEPVPPPAQPGEPQLDIDFGEYGSLTALLEADWEQAAEALELLGKDLVELAKVFDEGGTPDAELASRVAEQNQNLRDFALQVIGQLPTNNSGNGEFTHPVAQANLVAAILARGEHPLSTGQTDSIARQGAIFDDALERATLSYTESTPGLQKLLDEVELKESFRQGMRDVLTADQLAEIFHPETEGRVGLDLFSSGVMMNHVGRTVTVSSADELRPALMDRVKTLLDVSEADLAANQSVFDTWVSEVRPLLDTAVSVNRVGSYNIGEGVVAGRAQLRALEALSSLLQLSEEARATLVNSSTFFVPRLTQP